MTLKDVNQTTLSSLDPEVAMRLIESQTIDNMMSTLLGISIFILVGYGMWLAAR
jgi:hypothetical protein